MCKIDTSLTSKILADHKDPVLDIFWPQSSSVTMIFHKQLFILLVGLLLPVALLGEDLPDGITDQCATETKALSDNTTITEAGDDIVIVINLVTATATYTNTAAYEEACTDAGGSFIEKDLTIGCAGVDVDVKGAPVCLGTSCTDADKQAIAEAIIDIADDQCSTAATTTSHFLVSGAMLLLATTWSLL